MMPRRFDIASVFAGWGPLSNLCFSASVAFTAMVRRLDFGVLNKHEQTCNVVRQISPTQNEGARV